MQNATNHIKRELQLTADGSHTLFIPEMDEHYHSVNGAVQESRHVFIEAGLHHLEWKEIVVLEIGFGLDFVGCRGASTENTLLFG